MSMTLGVTLKADGSQARSEIVGVQDSLGRLHTAASVPMDVGVRSLESAARNASSVVPSLGHELQQVGLTAGESLGVAAAEVEALRVKFDPAYAATQRMTAQTRELKQALDAGAISQQRYAELLAQMSRASASAGASMGQIAQATRQLPMQMQDVFVSLQGGQNPLTVFMQQGSQIAGSYGSASLALRSVGTYALGLVNPFTLAAAAVAALGIAYHQGSQEADAYRLALTSTGNAAGTSAAQMADMARGMGSAWGTTQGAAAEALAAMAATGRVGSASLRDYAQVAVDMEKSFGVSVADTAKHFAELGKDPVGASAKLNESLNYLSASTYGQIKAAMELGETEKAAALAQDAYAKAMKGRAAEVVSNLGYMEQAWDSIKNVAKETWDTMLGVGRSSTPGQELAKAQKQLADRNASLKEYGNLGGVFGDDTATQVAKLEQQIYGLQEVERMQKRAGTAAAEKAASDKAGIAAIDAVAKANDAALTKQEQMKKALDDYRKSLKALPEDQKQSAEQIAKTEAAIRDKFKTAAPKKSEAETLAQQQAKAYSDWAAGIDEKTLAQTRELELGRKLTEAEKLELDIGRMVATGKISQAQAESEKTKAMVAAYAASARAIEVQAMVHASNAKAMDGIWQSVQALNEQALGQERANATFGLGKDALGALTLAQLEKSRADLQATENVIPGYLDALDRQIEAQKRLNAAVKTGEDQKKNGDNAKKALDEFNALTGQLDGSKLNGLFNGATDGAMKFVTALQLVATVQEKSSAAYAANLASNGADAVKLGEVQKQIAAQSAVATLTAYGAMAGALKGYAKEGSRTYAALQNAERVFQAFQLATTVATMAEKSGLLAGFTAVKLASDQATTTSTVTSAGTEVSAALAVGQANAVAAIPKQASSGDPYTAFPRMAAMAAIMAGLGFIVGGIGGGAPAAQPSNNGTGTVLGDPNAKSESLSKSLDQLNGTELTALNYSQQMARSLQNIEQGIGGFASLLVRGGGIKSLEGSINTGYSDNAISSAVKNPLITGVLGAVLSLVPAVGKLITSLFGTKTSITGSGIYAGAQTLGGIADGGFAGSYYADVNTKKKVLGVTYSSSNSTQYSALDDALERQISQIFGNVGTAVTAATQVLGRDLSDVQQKLAGYVVNLGRIDLRGLTGDQISEKLTNIFGAESDKIAQAIMPGLEGLQSVGEGYFQTLTRAASQMEVVNLMQSRLGATLQASGTAGAYLADSIVKAFGSLADYQTKIGDYYSAYYSEAERAAKSQQEITKTLASMGLAMPTTLAGYRALVDAQDLTTEAGRQTYASLINLSPAFKSVSDSISSTIKDLTDSVTGFFADLKNSVASARQGVADATQTITGTTQQPQTLAQIDAAVKASWVYAPSASGIDAAANQYASASGVVSSRAADVRAAQSVVDSKSGDAASAAAVLQDAKTKLANTSQTIEVYLGRGGYFGTGSKHYRYDPNPEYARAQNTVKAAQAAYDAAQSRLAQSQSDLAAQTGVLNAATQQQSAAQAAMQSAQVAYADAMRQYVLDANKAVTQLTKLKDQTLQYFNAQKALADGMLASAGKLRQAADNMRTAQLTAAETLVQQQAGFDQAYAMALSTTGTVQAGYADKMAAGLQGLSDSLKNTSATREDWALATAKLYAQSQTVASQLEANAPKDYQAESLAMLGNIDAALAALESVTASSEKVISDAINAASSKNIAGLHAVVAALTGQTVPGFAEGGYTGQGRKHEVAGLVHRGEVVWSQADVARAGGVGAVQQLRAGSVPVMSTPVPVPVPLPMPVQVGVQGGVAYTPPPQFVVAGDGGGANTAQLAAELAAMREQLDGNQRALNAIALNTMKTHKILDRVSDGGEALQTKAVA